MPKGNFNQRSGEKNVYSENYKPLLKKLKGDMINEKTFHVMNWKIDAAK